MKIRLIVAHESGRKGELVVEGPAVFTPTSNWPADINAALFEVEQLVNATSRLRLHIELQEQDVLAALRLQQSDGK